jgi:hypothetical protein
VASSSHFWAPFRRVDAILPISGARQRFYRNRFGFDVGNNLGYDPPMS